MGAKVGYLGKVANLSNKILGIGTWAINGITVDMLEDTEFGDTWKTYLLGLKDGGTVSFNGYYDPETSSYQSTIRDALENGTHLTDLRFYVDNSSYWRPNSTGTPSSYILVTGWDISADKSGLIQCSFSGKVCGKMDFV